MATVRERVRLRSVAERCTRKIRRCSSLARLRRRSDHELDRMSLQASWQRAVSWRGAASVHGEPPTDTLTRSPCCQTRRCTNKFGAMPYPTPITLSVLSI